MRDLRADWKRWSAAERVFAVVLAVVLTLASPVMMIAVGTVGS